MQINNILPAYGNNNGYFNKNCKISNHTATNYSLSFMGTPRVDKGMQRFLEFNDIRIPTTLREYLATLKDKLTMTPLEAQKNAYEKLKDAKNIQDVQRFFPEEELFIYLESIDTTKAKKGLLSVYREFKDIFQDGILTNGEDFTVYLLKKIFIEAKTLDEINHDLDNDLHPDIKSYFYQKNKDNTYVHSSTLKALGIYRPDTAYQNSLKFTREGYSDTFGLKISEALLTRWNKLTDEEKFEMLSKRCQGRDNWWNSLSYDEKLELATGVNEENELYKNYRKFTGTNRAKERAAKKDIPEYEKPKKKIKVGSNINDKDLFILWMKKNLEKFYANLTEEEKELISIKRSKRMALRWQEMSPSEKTEYINKLRIAQEPIRFAMIDAWNHSRILIRALSEFLSEKQVLRPENVVYASDEFSEFQSKIMTEFWSENRELAEDFGKKLKFSHQKVEDAIKSGQFEVLKADIIKERAERIKSLEQTSPAIADESKKADNTKEKNIAEIVDDKYKEDFKKEYKTYIDKHQILPPNYVKQLTDIMLKSFPKEFIIKYTKFIQDKVPMPDDILKVLTEKGNKHDTPELDRIVHALEAAIATELVAKGGNPVFFEMTSDALIPVLEQRAMNVHLHKSIKPDIERINRLYNDFRRDVDSDTGNYIIYEYFDSKIDNNESLKLYQDLANYIDTYGQSIKILFSDKSNYSDEVKYAFNQKFLKYMPKSIKDNIIPYINTMEDIQDERKLMQIKGQIAKRLGYIPDDVRERYLHTLLSLVRADKVYNNGFKIENIKDFVEKAKINSEHTFPKIPKHSMAPEDKFKMLAVEQALADELYRITKNYAVYSTEFEEAVANIEMCSSLKPNKREGVKITTTDGVELMFPERPNLKNLNAKYIKYYNEIKDLLENIKDYDDKIDTKELFYRLSPVEGKPQKDENIRKRIQLYFED